MTGSVRLRVSGGSVSDAMAGTAGNNQIPAGWYPTDDGAARYWDGYQWAPNGGPGLDAYPAQAAEAYPMQAAQSTNGIGMAGFILSIAAPFSWSLPSAGWVVWLAGVVLSLVGLSRQPRGFAIAGTIISFVSPLLVILFAVLFVGLFVFPALAG